MIIVRLAGGLGNQMFQYAAGRALALMHNTELKLDLRNFSVINPDRILRKFELEIFNVDYSIATQTEIEQFTKSKNIFIELQRLVNKYVLNNFSCLAYTDTKYYNKFCSLKSNSYISGYFQSEKYFEKYTSQILSDFSLRQPLDDVNLKWAEQIQNSNSVGIHIRRGDYTNKKHINIHGVCSISYYNEAIKYIKKLYNSVIFYVFSDDIDWSKANLISELPIIFVQHNTNNNSYKDLILMSLCRFNIISNSSFSWWAAYLNQNKDKIVIAPDKWYAKQEMNSKDILPDNWIKMNV